MTRAEPWYFPTGPDAVLVTAGIITAGSHILVCQRHRRDPYGLQWEFPGGKVEEAERPEEALSRELAEELSIDAEIGREVFRLRHPYPDRFVAVIFFIVRAYRGAIRNRVFEAVEWADRGNLNDYNFLEADVELVTRIGQGEIL